jgi:hypothetical protein
VAIRGTVPIFVAATMRCMVPDKNGTVPFARSRLGFSDYADSSRRGALIATAILRSKVLDRSPLRQPGGKVNWDGRQEREPPLPLAAPAFVYPRMSRYNAAFGFRVLSLIDKEPTRCKSIFPADMVT